MKSRHLTIAIVAASAVTVFFAPSASAAELGSNCQVATAEESGHALQWESSSTSYKAPSSGVITRWGSHLNSGSGTNPTRLKVFRPGSGIGQFTIAGESKLENQQPGPNSFLTRIPVLAGDSIGLHSLLGVGLCPAGPDETTLTSLDPVELSLGTEVPFWLLLPGRLALSATLEPDVDQDGFGDLTQDQCPQLKSVQAACPILSITNVAIAGRGFTDILVSPSTSAAVTVSATAAIPKIGKKRASSVTITTTPQTVPPGSIWRFKLRYPTKLRNAMTQLSKKQKIKVAVSISAVGIANTVNQPATLTLRKTKK